MKKIHKVTILAACAISALACTAVSFAFGLMSAVKAGISLAFALITVPGNDASDGVRANVRKWHGSMKDQFENINNLVNAVKLHPKWAMIPDMAAELEAYRDKLQASMNKCSTSAASQDDREARNSLLKGVVGYCLTTVKLWAYSRYNDGELTKDELHSLRFLLPGEIGGHHDRSESTRELTNVKVNVVDMENITVIIDQSNTENAALVHSGWPKGIHQAVISILSADGATEVYRQMTTRLYTDIEMPAGSRGKMFIAKAAFLKHIDDTPKFGTQQVTFVLPQTTEDLSSIVDKQHHEEYEARVRAVEDHRRDVEEREREAQKRKKLDDEEKNKRGGSEN
jgi:hypothetical protein